jgi:NADH-quinone oxidoreductase subunit N
VNLQSLVDALISDAVQTSLPRFTPELVLCGTVVALLLSRVIPLANLIPPFLLAALGSAAAFVAAIPVGGLAAIGDVPREELFTGMLVNDSVTTYLRLFLAGFAVLMIILARLTGLADRREGQDFYCLILGATIGMCLMASANHMLTLFLGVEMASVPSYALAGVVRGRRRSSEAALKYAVYGAGAAGVMLYGVSLASGVLESVHFPTMAVRLAEFDLPGKLAAGDLSAMVLALGGLMIGVGLAFKLSAVPFHFWCPDVFEGASAEVAGFLSIASKAAALVLLLRVGLGLTTVPPVSAGAELAAAKVSAADVRVELASAMVRGDGGEFAATDAAEADADPLSPARRFFVVVVGIVSAVTCTFGNLAAYGQKNIKRMLAYSTIAHAGYMMMPVAAAVALAGRDTAAASQAVSALLLYATIYLFMNLGAFTIVALLRNSMQSEEIADYAGLISRSPLLAVAMSVILFSLVGLPPLAGFWPKLRLLQSLFETGDRLLITVLVVAAFNTAISLVYYLRVAKTMCIDAAPDSSRPVELGFLPATYLAAVVTPVVLFGVAPGLIAPLVDRAASGLFG